MTSMWVDCAGTPGTEWIAAARFRWPFRVKSPHEESFLSVSAHRDERRARVWILVRESIRGGWSFECEGDVAALPMEWVC